MRPARRELPSLAMQVADLLDLLAIVIALGLVILTATGKPSLARVGLALAFLFFVPGRAMVTNWPSLGEWSAAAMAMLLSLSALALVAAVTLWAHAWHPVGLFQAEGVVSIVALVVGSVRRHARVRQQGRKAAQ